MIGLRVRRNDAEEVRRALASTSLVDTTRAIIEHEDQVILPLLATPSAQLLDTYECEVLSAEFPKRTVRGDPIDEIRRIACIPEELKHLMPPKWELFGNVLVLRLPSSLNGHEESIARAYALVLGAKAVLQDIGGVTGELRTPVTRLLFGTDTVTLHKENGVLFRFDARQIMFSSGNVDERVHAAGIRCDDEVVVDMFAGIGYFSIPIAVHQRPRRVVACELNPVAFAYLVENAGLNSVSNIVEPILGDNRDLEGESIADRVFMGYVKTTHEYLQTAIRLVRSGGMIHYHETCPCELLPERPISRVKTAAIDCDVEVLGTREVKSYSPGISHVVVDARVVKRG